MRPDALDRQRRIEKQLQEFHAAPGRFALARREPQLLFDSVREVLLLATGRGLDEHSPPPEGKVRAAACFFVRAAMLHPDADHYTLLGLPRSANAASLKDRYRQMMRLLHPDFTAGSSWPADAATRVNLAYDVLSSPVERRAYDERMARDEPPARPQAQAHDASRPQAPQRRAGRAAASPPDSRGVLKGLALACGGVGGLAVIGWVLATGSEKESLVQRERPVPARDTPVATSNAPRAQPQAQVAELIEKAAAVLRIESAPPLPPTAPQPAATQAVAERPRTEVSAPARNTEPLEQLSPPARAGSLPQAAAPGAAPPGDIEAARAALLLALAPPPTPAAAPAPPAPTPSPTPAQLPAPAPVLVAAPTSAPPPPPAPTAFAAAATPRPVARAPATYTGPTMADVQPFLTRLVREMESGWGDHMLSVLDRPARVTPAAQSVLAQFNEIVDGHRPVRVSNVQFQAQPRDTRLVVTGRLLIHPRDAEGGPREFAVEAEFVRQGGEITMTRLARAGS